MTNKAIANLYNDLSELVRESTVRLPARVSFSIIRNLHMLEPIAQDIDKARLSIIENCADPVPDEPGAYKIRPDKQQFMNKELNDLDSMENDINILKIKDSDIKDVELTLKELNCLYPMLES